VLGKTNGVFRAGIGELLVESGAPELTGRVFHVTVASFQASDVPHTPIMTPVVGPVYWDSCSDKVAVVTLPTTDETSNFTSVCRVVLHDPVTPRDP
jgi:hypothetical protein